MKIMEEDNKPVEPLIYKNNPKIISFISYFAVVGWLLAYILNSEQKSPFASFHIRQSLGIYLLFFLSGSIMWIPIVGWIVGAVGIMLSVVSWILGVISALKEEEEITPILGVYFQEWFAGL